MRRAYVVTDRRGMTLLELLISMIVFSVVMTGILGMMRKESEGFKVGTDRMSMLQNIRFAANLLEQDLRVLGANTPDEQPALIFAGKDVVAFSGDYATNIPSDPFAVFYNPDATNSEVMAMTKAQKAALPLTAFQYPDTSYTQGGGVNSAAETIIFYFQPDTSTAKIDDYALYRSVNNGTPALVARELLKVADGSPFFEYVRLNQVSGVQVVEDVPNGSLPLKHTVPIHLAAPDTALASVIDSVRAVRVNLRATNGRSGAEERFREVSRLVTLPNAGMAVRTSCGDTPILGTALNAANIVTIDGDPAIQLTWGQSVDESGGELDVGRYVIWRKTPPAPDWGAPFLSIPAGQPAYQYDDESVVSGDQWMYALAAQDCTPSISSLATTPTVVVP